MCSLTRSADELHAQYDCIFKSNRNAASHLWASHLLQHRSALTAEEFESQFLSFCAVSGSPLRGGGAAYQNTLRDTAGETVTVQVPHCCWPCACDLHDASMRSSLAVHEQTLQLADGAYNAKLLVMDDPCSGGGSIPDAAPDVTCVDGALAGAYRVADGKVVIGMALPVSEGALPFPERMCEEREERGFRGGMGTIFRDLMALG